MIPSGAQKKPMIIEAPKNGIPKIASRPPVTHLSILETDICSPPTDSIHFYY